jgi:hypothetical protein
MKAAKSAKGPASSAASTKRVTAGGGGASKGVAAHIPAHAAAKQHNLPEIDEKDDLVMNLKGQIFLLTVENEMYKRFAIEEAATSSSAASLSHTSAARPPAVPSALTASTAAAGASFFGASGGNGVGALNASTSSAAGLHAADLPSAAAAVAGGGPTPNLPELTDSFEVMRQKYATLEAQYHRDLDEKRRAAEALASQCAAQSSLIITLKREVEAANDTLRDQKGIAQQLEQRAQADVEVARRDIESLHARIEELNAIISDLESTKIRSLNAQISDLKVQVFNASAERNASEASRLRSLDSYGRQLVASRMLLRSWKIAKLECLKLGALAAKVSSRSGRKILL